MHRQRIESRCARGQIPHPTRGGFQNRNAGKCLRWHRGSSTRLRMGDRGADPAQTAQASRRQTAIASALVQAGPPRRSEERSVGKGGVRTCTSGWSTDHVKKNKHIQNNNKQNRN